ncbi:MAG: hypothetical protein HFG69_12400 [Hungatella sp.]|nr:hypothetical protein [Hungatella sp.]
MKTGQDGHPAVIEIHIIKDQSSREGPFPMGGGMNRQGRQECLLREEPGIL